MTVCINSQKIKDIYHTGKKTYYKEIPQYKYYKYLYQNWTQPVLTSNSSNSSFVVSASTIYSSGYDAWCSFKSNKTDSTAWLTSTKPSTSSPQWYQFKTSKKLKISKINMKNRGGSAGCGAMSSFKIQGSNNGSQWVDLTGTLSNSNNSFLGTWTINVNANTAYYYHRFLIYGSNTGDRLSIGYPTIVAQTQDVVESSLDDYDYSELVGVKTVEGTPEDYTYIDYDIKKINFIYKGSTLVYNKNYESSTIFESSTGGTYSVQIPATGVYEITVVGGGGAAAMRGVYDDKGYGWSGGSGGAFVGSILIPKGTYTVTVGKANNNTTAQSGNSQTLNPTDTGTYGSSIAGVVSVGGGGSGHYNSSYVGAAGAAPTFTIQPLASVVNQAGNAGASGSGGKGSAAAAVINGGGSVWGGYGKGQGCATSEYASKRYWINGTSGYVKIVYKGSGN
jgi:hypothetical protein